MLAVTKYIANVKNTHNMYHAIVNIFYNYINIILPYINNPKVQTGSYLMLGKGTIPIKCIAFCMYNLGNF